MEKVTLGFRILLGLIFVVFGLNGFLNFMPMPPMDGQAAAFMGALGATGYMFPVIKIVEITGGALLLSGRFVPLGLVLITPIVLNIFLFHAILHPSGLPMAGFLLVATLFLGFKGYRDRFDSILSA